MEAFIKKCENSDAFLRKEAELKYEDSELLSDVSTEVSEKQEFVCSTCEKVLSSKANLKLHYRTHAEHTWKCPTCLSKFKHKYDLRTHQKRVHSEGVRFICDLCTKTFKHRDLIQRHMKYFHLKAEKFVCKTCRRNFKNVGEMNYHYKTQHLGIKNQVCDECGRAYETPSRLKFHKMSVHMKLKPFKCDSCEKGQ